MNTPTIPQDLQDRVRARVDEYVQMVQQEWSHYTIPPIDITYKNSGTNIGLAYCTIHRVNFNPVLLLENPDLFFDSIIGHEVAHIVAVVIWGNEIADHGEEWREVMALFGIPPTVRYVVDTSSIKQRNSVWKHKCKCPDTVYDMGSRSNRYIMTNQRPHMICTICGTRLKPVDKSPRAKGLPKHLQHETKVNKARWVIKQHKAKPRNKVIPILQDLAGLTKAGASTYYHNLMKELVD